MTIIYRCRYKTGIDMNISRLRRIITSHVCSVLCLLGPRN